VAIGSPSDRPDFTVDQPVSTVAGLADILKHVFERHADVLEVVRPA
jgi:hypothetical protein